MNDCHSVSQEHQKKTGIQANCSCEQFLVQVLITNFWGFFPQEPHSLILMTVIFLTVEYRGFWTLGSWEKEQNEQLVKYRVGRLKIFDGMLVIKKYKKGLGKLNLVQLGNSEI